MPYMLKCCTPPWRLITPVFRTSPPNPAAAHGQHPGAHTLATRKGFPVQRLPHARHEVRLRPSVSSPLTDRGSQSLILLHLRTCQAFCACLTFNMLLQIVKLQRMPQQSRLQPSGAGALHTGQLVQGAAHEV